MAKHRKHQTYDREKRDFITAKLIEGASYSNIIEAFDDKFGWKPDKGWISKFKKSMIQGIQPTPVPRAHTQGEIYKENDESTHSTAIQDHNQPEISSLASELRRKTIDTIEVRTYLVVQMVKLIKDSDITAEEKIRRLTQLTPTIFRGLDGIDAAQRATMSIQAEEVNITMGLDMMTKDQRNEFYKRFQEEVCPHCPWRNGSIIDVSEANGGDETGQSIYTDTI